VRVVVTGDRGYIGSVLALQLMGDGHDVFGLDADLYAGCDFGYPPARPRSLQLDVRDVRPSHLLGFDAVIHLAALSNDPLGDLSTELTSSINLDGTLTLARAAREAGVSRFIFASSCSMYGVADPDAVLDEEAPLRPLTPYAESKVRAEEALWELAGDDFCPVSMRNATVYGVSPRLRLDVVLNNLAAWAHTTGRVRLLSDGTSWRPLIHVRDVGLVTRHILEAPQQVVRGAAYNVGSSAQNYLVRDLAELIAEESGCAVETAAGATSDPRSYRVDFSKLARTFPGLKLEWDAARGIHELIEAYRANGLTEAAFGGDSFVRLRRIRHLLEGGELDDTLRRPAEPDA
jgi:nucleoside-diphosphate-sugar epimerase